MFKDKMCKDNCGAIWWS